MAKNPYASEIKWWKNRAAEFDAKRAAIRPLSFEHVSGAYKYAGNKNGEWTFDSSKIGSGLGTHGALAQSPEWQSLMSDLKTEGDRLDYLSWGFARAKWPEPKKKGAGGTVREPTHPSVLKPSDKILDLEHQNDTLFSKIGDIGGTFIKGAFKGLAAVGDVLERTGFMVRSVVEENMNEYKGADTAGGADITTGEFLKSIGKSFGTFTPQIAAARALTGSKEQKEEFSAAWQGLSGKNKVWSEDLLKEIYPEWTSNHKKWTVAFGFAGDIASNPLTYVTMGEGAVAQGLVKGTGALGLKAAGRTKAAESLLSNTVWSSKGRQAGKEALQDWAKMRDLKPQYKDVRKAGKANVRAQKQAKKASPTNASAAQAKVTRTQKALDDASEALVSASTAQIDDAYKGLSLARKALFNKTLGFGSYNAYSKGVRAGGTVNGAAKAFDTGMKALRLRYANDLFKGPQAPTFRKFHAITAGKTLKLAGQTHTVPTDYDDFIEWFANKVYPHVPIKELTKAAAKRRYAIDNAVQARGKQFYYDFIRQTENTIRQHGLEPPDNWSQGIPSTPGPTPTPPGRPRPLPPGSGGPNRPPGGGGGNGAAPTPEPPTGWGEDLPDFESVPTPTGPHTTVRIQDIDADDDVSRIIDAGNARRAEDQRYFENMTDAERVYAERMGYSPSLMSYQLFAKHLIDHTNPENIAIVTDFINDVKRGLAEAQSEGRLTQGGETAQFRVGAEGMPEIQNWKAYRDANGTADYDRQRNSAIAQVISEAWHTAQYKLAVTALANDPVSVVNALQGSTAHIINQLSADTHIQVSQYLTSKYGLSFLPMAPNRSVIHAGGLRGVIQKVSDITPFVQRGVKSKPSLSERNVKGDNLYRSIYQTLQQDVDEGITKLFYKSPDDPGIESDIADSAHIWLNRKPDEYSFKDSDIARMALGVVAFAKDSTEFKMAIPGSTPQMQNLNDAMYTILSKGEHLINDIHYTHDESISKYSLMDHWVYGENAAKEMNITQYKDKTTIGRLAHVEKISGENQAILANLKETLPNMDEDLLSAMRLIKASIAKHSTLSEESKLHIHDFMNTILAPDWTRLHTGMDGTFGRLTPERAMETLGWHLNTLTNTQPGGTSIAVRAAMAQEIWSLPILYKELNQSVMLGTLHHVLAMRRNPEQAADAIASLVKKYPLVEDILSGAHAAGTTNGTNGIRRDYRTPTVHVTQVDPNAPVPAPVPAGGLPEPPVGPIPAPATVDAVPHNAAERTPTDDPTPATDPKPSATSSKPSPKTEVEGNAAAAAGNPPGGFTTPTAATPEQLDEVNKFIDEMRRNVNLAEVQRVVDDAKSALDSAMAEYHAAVKTEFENFRIKTGKVVRFMGMPVAPVPGLLTPGQSYAGVIGLKERQSRVTNWLDKAWPQGNESRLYAQLNLRRASKGLDSVLNDIRRSVANNAQERLIATHQHIRTTYIQFKNKAERVASTRVYFEHGTPLPPKFKDVEDRMKMIGDSIRMEPDGKVRSPKIAQMYAEQFNRALPKKYQLPPEVFNGKMLSDLKKTGNALNGEMFSRDWFIDVSRWMSSQGTHQNHVLAEVGVKNRLHMGNYEFALQHALMKLELSRDFHLSMFDNFTFRMDEELVKTMNKDLKFEDQFVKLDTYYGAETTKYVNAEYANRWVRRGMADEMSKVTRWIENQNTYRAGNINFGMMTKINNWWKSMVTNWNIPKYHIGNVMADGFLNAMDGVKPDAYRKAALVMTNSHPLANRIKNDPDGYSMLMHPDLPVNPGEYAREMQELGDPARARVISMIMVNGKPTPLDSEMLFKLYHDYGLGQTQVNGNILRSSAIPHNKPQEFYTKTTDYVLDLSNGREDFFRIAHFISALESESKIARRPLEDIVIAARDRVIKYHFDYGDVTEFERLAVARYLPFYKWQRNILPLAVGQFFTNPRMYTVGNAANKAMGEMLFPSQEDANGNVIPVDYITPSFVGDANMVPIGKYTDPDGNEQARYAVLNLPLDQALVTWIMPFVSSVMDPNVGMEQGINQGARNTASTLLSKANPFIVAMAQAGLGKTAVAGDSFPSKPNDWLRTLASVAAPDSGQIIEGIENRNKGEAQKTWGDQLGIIRERKNTPGIQRGTLREENDKMTAVYAKAAAKWMARNYPGVDPKSEEGKKILHDYFVSTGTLQK